MGFRKASMAWHVKKGGRQPNAETHAEKGKGGQQLHYEEVESHEKKRVKGSEMGRKHKKSQEL